MKHVCFKSHKMKPNIFYAKLCSMLCMVHNKSSHFILAYINDVPDLLPILKRLIGDVDNNIRRQGEK